LSARSAALGKRKKEGLALKARVNLDERRILTLGLDNSRRCALEGHQNPARQSLGSKLISQGSCRRSTPDLKPYRSTPDLKPYGPWVLRSVFDSNGAMPAFSSVALDRFPIAFEL
jgi:hypothetical protein